MTQYKHIVQVHPVVNGRVNLGKVVEHHIYDEKWRAETLIEWLNEDYEAHKIEKKAVYRGRVNDATGELE